MQNILSILKYIWSHPANRGRKVQAISRAIRWQICKRIQKKPIDIRVFGDITLRCYPDSPSASLVIYCKESPDYHEMHFMRRYLRSGDNVLDVGANIGVYSLLAASLVGSTGRVLAFEPGPEANRRLTENIQINQLNNVEVHACALGDRLGVVDFLNQQDTTNRIKTEADAGESVISVPLKRLDDVVKSNYSLGKMDIEGAEPIALRGAERLLTESNPPVWLLELNGSLHSFGFNETTFSSWLHNQGYEIALYDADRFQLNFTNSQPWKMSSNVLAVARDRKLQVAQRCGASLIDV